MGCGATKPQTEAPASVVERNPIAPVEEPPVRHNGIPSDIDEHEASVVSLPMPESVRLRQMEYGNPELQGAQGPKDTDDLRGPAARLLLALEERDEEADIPGGRQIGMSEQIALAGLRTNFLAPYSNTNTTQ